MMRSRKFVIAGLLAASLGSVAFAHEGDAGVAVVNGQIVTGKVEENSGGSAPVEFITDLGQRVFLAEMNLDAGSVFAADPGFFSGPLGSASGPVTMPANSSLGFVLTRQLYRWSGSTFVPSDHSMRVEFASGALSVRTPNIDQNVVGFGIPTGTGTFDEHWDLFLDGPEGSSALSGIYALEFHLTLPGTNISQSESLWFVMNYGDSEAAHEASEEYLEANLVIPSPAAAGLFAVAGLAGLKRRRA